MDDLISRQLTVDHLKRRLLETAFNNIGVRALCDTIFVDIADNRIDTWIKELPSAQLEIKGCPMCINCPDNCTLDKEEE